eukprot:1437514-Rhodomonas_salina.2
MPSARFHDWKRLRNDAIDLMNTHVNLQPSLGTVSGSSAPFSRASLPFLVRLFTPLLLRLLLARDAVAGSSERLACSLQKPGSMLPPRCAVLTWRMFQASPVCTS